MGDFVNAGKVTGIASSDTKNGKMYRIEVEDLDTGDVDWFGLGNEEPDFGEGSEVSFEFEENGKFLNILADSLEVIDLVEPKKRGGRNGSSPGGNGRSGRGNGDNKSSGSRSRGGNGGGRNSGSRGGNGSKTSGSSTNRSGSRSGSKDTGKSKGGKADVDWDMKDKKIGLLAMRNSAIAAVSAAVEAGAIKLGTKQADKFDNFFGYIDQVTARFLEQEQDYIESDYDIGAICEDAGDGDDDED